jgi:hypothetical protein
MLRRATIGLKWVALSALIVGAFTYAVADRNPLGVAGGKAMAMTSPTLPGILPCYGVCATETVKKIRRNDCDTRRHCDGECEYYTYTTQSCSAFRLGARNCQGTATGYQVVDICLTGCFTQPQGCACQDDPTAVIGTTTVRVDDCMSC